MKDLLPQPLRIEDGTHLFVHAAAREAFEAWLRLPKAVRDAGPGFAGLVMVVPDEDGLGVVAGFSAFLKGRAAGAPLIALRCDLEAAEIAAAAEGEVAPLAAALAHGAQGRASSERTALPIASLLERVLREEAAQ